MSRSCSSQRGGGEGGETLSIKTTPNAMVEEEVVSLFANCNTPLNTGDSLEFGFMVNSLKHLKLSFLA